MELLRTIADGKKPENREPVRIRSAARMIALDENGLMPVLHIATLAYHKLPGGGIKQGETVQEALAREMREETGCEVEVSTDVGRIVEYRSEWDMLQTSDCFIGTVVSKGEPALTEKEIRLGAALKWMTVSEAILRLNGDNPSDYEGKFIRQRDLLFLKHANIMLEE